MRIVDTRHEGTATFAAEAYAKLTRKPGLAVLTAGPGVTNGVSAVTSAHFNGSPRRRARRAGAGAAMGRRVVAGARPAADPGADHEAGGDGRRRVDRRRTGPRRRPPRQRAASRAGVPRLPARRVRPLGRRRAGRHGRTAPTDRPIPDAVARLAALIADAERPAFLVGSDAYWDGAWRELEAAAEALGVPCFFNGLGRGMLPADHPLAFLRTRSALKERADVVVVIGTPLDFRVGFGRFGDARVAHVVDAASRTAAHVEVPTVAGDIAATLRGLAEYTGDRLDHTEWIAELRDAERGAGRCRGSAAGGRRRSDQAVPGLRRAAQATRPRRGRDLRRRRLRLVRRQVRRGPPAGQDGSTPGRTAASATGSATRSRRGSCGPIPRSSCCSATAPPASR